MRIVAVPDENADALTRRTFWAGIPKVHVPVDVVELAVLAPLIPEIAEKLMPSALISNCSVPEYVPETVIVAAVVESVGLLNSVSTMQAFVVAQVVPEAVMFPVELSWENAGEERIRMISNFLSMVNPFLISKNYRYTATHIMSLQ
jgi:hypothetical protein